MEVHNCFYERAALLPTATIDETFQKKLEKSKLLLTLSYLSQLFY